MGPGLDKPGCLSVANQSDWPAGKTDSTHEASDWMSEGVSVLYSHSEWNCR